jgi:hypothetical protein
MLNAGNSNTTDSQISASKITFQVLADPTNAVPAAHQLYTDMLTGISGAMKVEL